MSRSISVQSQFNLNDSLVKPKWSVDSVDISLTNLDLDNVMQEEYFGSRKTGFMENKKDNNVSTLVSNQASARDASTPVRVMINLKDFN